MELEEFAQVLKAAISDVVAAPEPVAKATELLGEEGPVMKAFTGLTEDIAAVQKALVGEDGNGGLIARIERLEGKSAVRKSLDGQDGDGGEPVAKSAGTGFDAVVRRLNTQARLRSGSLS